MDTKAVLLSATLLLSAACTEGTVGRKTMTTEPEPVSRLSPEERAGLRSGVDADALERMLASLPPQHREEILGFFRSTGVHRGIVGAKDPVMNGMLGEVWKPGRTAAGEAFQGAAADYGRVTIILAEHLDARSAGALVIREPGMAGERIVLDPSHANPLQLFRAIGTLMQSRFTDGYPAAHEIRIPVEVVRIPEDLPAAAEAREMATRIYGPTIDRLLAAEPADVAQFGRVRATPLVTGPPITNP